MIIEDRLEACRILGQQLDAKISRIGMSKRRAATEIGVSASTVSRLINHGSNLDIDNEILIRRWIGLPMSIGTLKGTGDTLADIRTALEADSTLDAIAVDALHALMTNAYKSLKR